MQKTKCYKIFYCSVKSYLLLLITIIEILQIDTMQQGFIFCYIWPLFLFNAERDVVFNLWLKFSEKLSLGFL